MVMAYTLYLLCIHRSRTANRMVETWTEACGQEMVNDDMHMHSGMHKQKPT